MLPTWDVCFKSKRVTKASDTEFDEILEGGYSFKCPVCNGNILIGPDDVVISCNYCGQMTTIDGRDVGEHLFRIALDEPAHKKGFVQFLQQNCGINKSLPQRAHIVEQNLIYVPIWLANVRGDSYYKGYRTVMVPVEKSETYTDEYGNTQTRTWVEFYPGYVPVSDEIHTETREVLLARKAARFYGISEYVRKIDLSQYQRYSFEAIKPLNPIMLNGEIGREEFERTAQGNVADRHYSTAGVGLTELFFCDTTTSVRNTTYIQSPYVMIRYIFEGKSYKTAIDGATGGVILGEIPITRGQRIMWTIIGFISTFLTAITVDYYKVLAEDYYLLMGDEIPYMYLMKVILAFIVTVLGLYGVGKGFGTLVKTEHEKKGAGELQPENKGGNA